MYNIAEKSYNDAVYGQIKLGQLQLDLLELPELQRLGYVNQLGLKNLIYRGATHKRIEHSVGVSYLGSMMARKFELHPADHAVIITAGILHDVAHFPFSHTLEGLLDKNHMEYVSHIFDGQIFPDRSKDTISEVLQRYGFKPEDIAALINGNYEGNTPVQNIVHGPIDADQLDFLQRDALHTGNIAGQIRLSRIMEVLCLKDDQVAVCEKGISDAEHFMYARKKMYEDVYLHPVARVAETMLSKAAKKVIGQFTVEQIIGYRDEQFLSELSKKGEYQKEMVQRILERDLFKRAYEIRVHEREKLETVKELNKIGADKLEAQIAAELGISTDVIIVDFPENVVKITEPRINPKKDIPILLKNGNLARITDLRNTAKAILMDPPTSNIFGVYVPEKYKESTARTVRELYFR